MNAGEFAYWLQGAMELSPEMLEKGMTPGQVQTIQDHLNLVFDKVTPDRFNKDVEINVPTLSDFRISNSGPSTGPPGSQLFCSQVQECSNLSPLKPVRKVPNRRKSARMNPDSKC